jgi:hypothetical protein
MSYTSPLLSPGGGNGTTDTYEAVRTGGGWVTSRRMSPPGSEATMPVPGGVAPDHLFASTNVGNNTSSMRIEGETEWLVNPDGTFELVGQGSLGSEPMVDTRWISDGGEHIVFTTGLEASTWCKPTSGCKVRQLEPNAPPTGTGAIYDRSADGPTRVVSLLPGDTPPAAGEEAFFRGVSRDGTSVAFVIGGALYVRVDVGLPSAKTIAVAGGTPVFAGLSDNGRYLFYVVSGAIHRLDTETGADQQVGATADAKVVSVSADGSHVYFISEQEIAGKGVAGQPNLYVWSGGTPDHVATLLPGDVPPLTNWTTLVLGNGGVGEYGLGASAARTTPDGNAFVFEAQASLTSYDNSGHTQIYRFTDVDDRLECVSCSPLTEPAAADARLQEPILTGVGTVIHNLSADGRRVFFETSEALVDEDSGAVNDIYQWHENEGGAIELDLISSGKSVDYAPGATGGTFQPKPNVLLSVTPDGEDVVFLSQDVLAPGAGEGGTTAIYDARIGGGFPAPAPPASCVEDGCRSAPAPGPSLLGPQSEFRLGSGNLKPRKRKPHCQRRKHQKHRHCSRKKGKAPGARAHAATAGGSGKERSAGTETPPEPSGVLSHAAPEPASAGPVAGAVTSAGLFDDYGIESVEAGESTTAAGMHPDFTTEITLNHSGGSGPPITKARTEEVSIALPPGLLGDPDAIPQCSTGEFVSGARCPVETQVGVSTFLTTLVGGKVPVYNLMPPHPDREIARFGFYAFTYPVFIDVSVRTASDYGATATAHSASSLDAFISAKTTIWGNPSDPSHDEERLTQIEAFECPGTACKAPGGKRPSTLPPTVFLSNPSACQAQKVDFAAKSYQLPGKVFTASAPMAPIVACSGLPFAPTFEAAATNPVPGAPTGLKTTLILPQQPNDAVSSPSTATIREVRVTLPEGMTLAAGAAASIEACSEAHVGQGQEVDAACPNASKLGTVTIDSHLLPRPIPGELFLRTPRPGHLFGFWLVSDEMGLHVKIPGELQPNKSTGQLTAVFSDLPQVPLRQIDLNVWGGTRAPLANPDSCGTFVTTYTLTPHSNDPPVTRQSQMTIDENCGGSTFDPKLHAGTTNPTAGAFSPFVFDLERSDREQNIAALDVTLPKGLLAQIRGVGLCPDAAAAGGNCPVSSRIGHVTVAAGAGPFPLWLPQPGKAPAAVYLAGPYRDAPFSIVAVVPAQAGTFDLGNVVVRSALKVDRETAQATVASDPLPQFVEGVAASYRRIHVVIDRSDFTLNPTDCSEKRATSKITSSKGAVAHPSSRFQVDSCKTLKFRPRVDLKLKGGTNRGDYPALSAIVKARKGDANIGRVSVALPHSEFLAQEHIVTICTRKRFAVDECPKGSIYGKAKAWTPLLSQPLQGPVYLRSSDNPLPDLVMSLEGEIDIALVGRIDSVNQGIRTTFDAVPDAPITKFVLKMRGGKKSLLVNSQNICRGRHLVTVRMRAQNRRAHNSRPQLEALDCRN